MLPLPPQGGGEVVQLVGHHAQVEEDRAQQPGCLLLTTGVRGGLEKKYYLTSIIIIKRILHTIKSK